MHEGPPPELSRYRSSIDEIDRRLLELCRQRFEICLQAADLKKKNDIPMMQPERVAQVQRRALQPACRSTSTPCSWSSSTA